jgi:hypothetical protein
MVSPVRSGLGFVIGNGGTVSPSSLVKLETSDAVD